MAKELESWNPPKETFLFRFQAKTVMIITSFFIFFILKVLNRSKFYGMKVIRKEKAPYIFASNHTTMFDSGFLDCFIFFRQMYFNYKLAPYHTPEYGNFYKNKLMAWYMDHAKCIPLERGKGLDQPAQKIVSQKLTEGNIVHIFPEGTRSRTGKLLSGKGGIGKRIYETKVKVIPCYHEGMRDILPVGKYFPRMGKKVSVIIGEPIYFDEFFEKENIPETWRAISIRIMEEIALLRDKLHKIEGKLND